MAQHFHVLPMFGLVVLQPGAERLTVTKDVSSCEMAQQFVGLVQHIIDDSILSLL